MGFFCATESHKSLTRSVSAVICLSYPIFFLSCLHLLYEEGLTSFIHMLCINDICTLQDGIVISIIYSGVWKCQNLTDLWTFL